MVHFHWSNRLDTFMVIHTWHGLLDMARFIQCRQLMITNHATIQNMTPTFARLKQRIIHCEHLEIHRVHITCQHRRVLAPRLKSVKIVGASAKFLNRLCLDHLETLVLDGATMQGPFKAMPKIKHLRIYGTSPWANDDHDELMSDPSGCT